MKGNLDKINIDNFDFIVIDAMNMTRKYYWVMRNLSDSKGRKTGVIYGIINFIRNFKLKYRKAKIIMAWDTRPTEKKNIDKEYKANRKHQELTDLWEQIRELKIMLSFYNVDQYFSEGYEADDIVAKVVKENKGKRFLLVSMDQDWAQLLNENVFIYQNNIIMSRKDYEKKNEINVEGLTLFKTIVGDKGDNVIGIPRMNKKFVWEHVKKYSTLKYLFFICNNYLETGTPKYRKYAEIILENKELLEKNYRLIKLIDEGYEIKKIERVNDKKRLISKLKEYDMHKLCERIENE